MTLYLIAIGGTGAKCAEAVVHLAAANLLGKDSIRIMFVDQDKSNGNLARTKDTVDAYRQCQELFEGVPQKPLITKGCPSD